MPILGYNTNAFASTSVRWVIITAADFTGNDYTNALLNGLTADEDFQLFSNDGSGTLLKVNDGYTFSGTTITTTPGNYRLQIIR